MAGDRSGFRSAYPGILSMTENDALEDLRRGVPPNGDPSEWRQVVISTAEDAKRIREGVTMVPWPTPGDDMIVMIRFEVVGICMHWLNLMSTVPEAQSAFADAMLRLGMGVDDWRKAMPPPREPITDEEFSALKQVYRWEEVFLTIPVQRIIAVPSWQRPFDVVEARLSESNYPVSDNELDKMHGHIARAHDWFGVGEWNIANRHYLNALVTAIATNNCAAIEAVVRFLVDTYVATGDEQSAANIATDFLDSPAYTYLRRFTTTMTGQTLEAVVVAFALARRLDKSREWIEKIPVVCGRSHNQRVEEWNIVQLLVDVYKFRQDGAALSKISTATREVHKLL